MTKKYKVTKVTEKQIKSQEVFVRFKDTLNNENDRYVAYFSYEANELLQGCENGFIFKNFPTIHDVERKLRDEMRYRIVNTYIRALQDVFTDGVCVYDTKTGESIETWKVVEDKNILNHLIYEREFEISVGDLEEIYVEDIK